MTRIHRVKRFIDEISEVLYQNQFTIDDFEGDLDTQLHKIKRLKECDVISVVGEKKREYEVEGDTRARYINIYEWNDPEHGKLQCYYEERNELPCGCRSHIPGETDENGRYICKFCEAKHSEDVIRNAL